MPSSTLTRNARLEVRGRNHPDWLRYARLESDVKKHFPLSEAAVIELHRVYSVGSVDRVIEGSEVTVIVPVKARAEFFRTKEKPAGNDAATRKGHCTEEEYCENTYLAGVAFYVPNVAILAGGSVLWGQLTCKGGELSYTEYTM